MSLWVFQEFIQCTELKAASLHTNRRCPWLCWPGSSNSLDVGHVVVCGERLSVSFSLPYGCTDCKQAFAVVVKPARVHTWAYIGTHSGKLKHGPLASVPPQRATLALLLCLWPSPSDCWLVSRPSTNRSLVQCPALYTRVSIFSVSLFEN